MADLQFLNWSLGFEQRWPVRVEWEGGATGGTAAAPRDFRRWVELLDGAQLEAHDGEGKARIAFRRGSDRRALQRTMQDGGWPILVRLEWTMEGGKVAEGELVVSRCALPSSLAEPPVLEFAPGVEAPTQREIGAWLRRLVLVTPGAALLIVQTPILGVGPSTAGTVSLFHADGHVLRCDIAGTPGRERLVVRAVEPCPLRVGALRFIEIPRMSQLRVVSPGDASSGLDLALLAPVDHVRLRGWLEYELRRDQLDEERFGLREESPLEFNEVDSPYGDKPTYPLRVVAADGERLKGWCEDLVGERRQKVSIAAEVRSLEGGARPIPGTVVAVRARAAAIEVSFSPRDPSARLFARGRICATLDQGRARERERRRRALERLVAGAVASPDLLRCLLDPAAVKGEAATPRMAPRPGARGLNDAQRAAVERVLAGHPITLVQGPPGTGKTQVIVEIVMQLRDRRRGIRGAEAAETPLRVLVSSVQNDAVENALKRLAADGVEVYRRVSRERQTGDEAEGEVLAARLEASLARDPGYARRVGVDALLGRVRVLQDVADADPSDEALADAMRGVAESASAAVLSDAVRSDLNELLRTVPVASATRAEAGAPSTIPDALLRHPSLDGGEAQAAAIDEFVRALEQVPDDAHALAAAQWRRVQRALLRAVRQGEIDVSLVTSWHQARERTPTRVPSANATTTSRWRGDAAAWMHRARHALEVELVETDRSEAAVLHAWIETLRYEPGALRRMKERHAPVVAATCQLAAPDREPDTEDLFDLVIVDEAARAGIDVFIPMGLGRQVVLVGDHQQLPPHVEEEVAARMEQEIREAAPPSESLFRWLWERLPETHRVALQCQYRMHEDIGSVVSEVFYEPELVLRHHHTGTLAARRAPCFGLFGDRAMVWIDTSAAVRNDATQRLHNLRWPIAESNEYEVEIIIEIIRKADRATLRRMQAEMGAKEVVGVIPFYSQQVARVRQRLQELDLELHDMVRTGTVDSFQGMEFPLVILSCVRSNVDGSVGFLRLPQRVNVALSRAQRQVVIVGDAATVGRDPEHPFGKVLSRLRQREGAVRSSSEVIS